MTDKREDQGGWKGKEWAGEDAPKEGAEKSATWTKTEYVGDQGEGLEAPIAPEDMAEGDSSISGNRHGSGESHWDDTAPAADTVAEADPEATPKA